MPVQPCKARPSAARAHPSRFETDVWLWPSRSPFVRHYSWRLLRFHLPYIRVAALIAAMARPSRGAVSPVVCLICKVCRLLARQGRPGHIGCLRELSVGDTRCAPFRCLLPRFSGSSAPLFSRKGLQCPSPAAYPPGFSISGVSPWTVEDGVTNPARPVHWRTGGEPPFTQPRGFCARSAKSSRHRPHLAGNANRCIRDGTK